jgi:hypothetical protein
VFNDLLIDSISRIGRELCGASSTKSSTGGEDSSSLTALLIDLKRMCCSSEYMFFYAQELLTETEEMLRTASLKRGRAESSLEEGEADESGLSSLLCFACCFFMIPSLQTKRGGCTTSGGGR